MLRDYQRDMCGRILDALRCHDAVMCQMPTGTGKTHVLAAVVDARAKGLTVWVVAHRRELVEQIRGTWERCYAGRRRAPDVKVMSIQWLARNWDRVGTPPSMIVIDEAHHALAQTYLELFRRYPEAKKLGMTATPYRLSGKGFAGLFEVLLQGPSIPECVMRRRLSLFDYFTVPPDSKVRRQIAMLKRRGTDGDYLAREMEASLNTPRFIEYLYNSLVRYAPRRRGIVYAINISHARAIAEYYAGRGLRCCAIDCTTPPAEREQMVEEFRRGLIDVMVNVDIFSEGFDCPEVEVIQLARPTLSLAVYLQQVGRGLRKAKGKKYCVILDNVGLSHTFGTPVREWDWQGAFSGKAAGFRIDSGDARALVGHIGYPGRLADEPMERVIAHADMDVAIRHEGLLEYFPEEGLTGIRIGGRVVAKERVLRVMAAHGDMVAVRLKDGPVRLYIPDGAYMDMPDDFRDFEVYDHGIVRVVTAGGDFFVDVVSKLRFVHYPVFEQYGPMEFIGNGDNIWLRDNVAHAFDAEHKGRTSWNDFYFKSYGRCPIAAKAYIPDARIGGYTEGAYSYAVLFQDALEKYFLVSEGAKGRIIVVNYDLQYFLVGPDLSRKYLFTATSWQGSKQELERWLKIM